MLPNTKIIISKDGSSKIEGQESTPLCHKLSELGRMAGKVASEKKKDHTPVHQTVNQGV